MKKTLNTMAITAAVCLTLGGVAQAGSMGYPEERYSVTEIDTQPTVVTTQPTIVERRVVTTQPTVVERRVVTRSPSIAYEEPSLARRIVTWPYRAARTAVRTPVIVGETLAGRREVASDRGLFARDRDVIYRDDDFRTRRTVRRLSSRPLYRTGNVIERGAESTGRGIVRTGRTVVRSPMIVGETLTGQREIINEEGRPFAR